MVSDDKPARHRIVGASVGRLSTSARWRLSYATAKGLDLWKAIRWRLNGLAWTMFSQSVYRLALLYRPLLRRTVFIGITGSAGKTTAKDLAARVLEHARPRGRKGPGTFNGPYDVARLILRTGRLDAYCITEIAISKEAGIDLPLALFRPTVGVVTNIGGDHLSVYGSLDGIAEEKSKLIRALPPNGIAVLNADDPRVLAMQSQFAGRTVTYGISNDAMVRGEAIEASWPDRLSLTVRWNGQAVRIQTQLCGSLWVPTVLAAVATGVALDVPLDVAAEALASVAPFDGRMSPVSLADGVTFIRDDWKAPLWTIAPAFEFMQQARASRKIIVVGTISDYTGDSTKQYVRVAEQALTVADCVIFVGPRASAGLRARRSPEDQLFAFPSTKDAATFLAGYLRREDLVLLKGSARTEHLERLVIARTGTVKCWRMQCGRWRWCYDECPRFEEEIEPGDAASADTGDLAASEPLSVGDRVSSSVPPLVVVGLGNPGERYTATPHNVGQNVVDLLAQRFDGSWAREGDLAMVFRTHCEKRELYLVKLLARVNEAGPPLRTLARRLGCTAQECILVHDDLDLPIGGVRSRLRGSDGGHRGVRSIIQSFQDDRIPRVKIGVGKPGAGQAVEEFVLTPFPAERLAVVDAALHTAAERVVHLANDAAGSRSHSSI